jgi:Zn-dependent peptidase ImmA (M78 family)
MPTNLKFRYGFKAKAERLSEKYRAELHISKFDPLDAFKLAAHLEIPINNVDDFSGLISEGHLMTLRNTAKFSAMWIPNGDGKKIIIHNNYHSEKRQQSNIMHELSHIILEHQISDETAKLCFLYNLPCYNIAQEEEAKYLGGALQLTRPGLLWAIKRKNDEQISDYYNASADMVRYRLNITGVLRQRNDQSSKKSK